MRPLSAAEILNIWERGQRLHPVDKALVLLSTAEPEVGWEQLASLPVGRRDDRLLALRELTFGSRLSGYAECPQCKERLEFELDTSQMRAQSGEEVASAGALQIGDISVRYRLPDSFDLAAIAGSPDTATARQALVRRCVLEDDTNGQLEALSPMLEEQLAKQMAQADPLADIQVDLSCLVCGHHWQLTFDITSFFWTEINSLAKRLLREVHLLARSYGWREADILSMGATRRQAYLEMVMG